MGTPVGLSDPDLVRQMYCAGASALCLLQNPAKGVEPINQQTQGLKPLKNDDGLLFVEEASLCLYVTDTQSVRFTSVAFAATL